ncbi:tetratricopeptide repeat protein [Candidatus Dependentiae bacterium]|nr:tetratricopeptide repeat protein [Candidatus Dependentiae bacterium]
MYKLIKEYFKKSITIKEIDPGHCKRFDEYLEFQVKKHKAWPDVKFLAGLSRLRNGKLRSGKKSIEESLKLNPNYIKALEVHVFLLEQESKKGLKKIKEKLRSKNFKGENRKNLFYIIELLTILFHKKKKIKLDQRNFNLELLGLIFDLNPNFKKINGTFKKFQKIFSDTTKLSITEKSLPGLKIFIQDYYKKEFIYSQYYFKFGNFFLAELDLENARLCFEKAVLAFPDNANYFLGLANIEYRKDNPKQSRKYLEQAITFDKNYSKLFATLSEISGYEGNYSEAAKNLKKALKLNPSYPDLHYHLGLLYSDLGEFKKAIKYFENAIRINPHYKEVLINLGRAYYDLKKYNEAIDKFETCLKEGLNYPEVYFYLGSSYLKKKNLDKGVEFLRTAIRNDRTYPEPYLELMKFYLNKDKVKAKTYLNQLKQLGYIDLVPKDIKRKLK